MKKEITLLIPFKKIKYLASSWKEFYVDMLYFNHVSNPIHKVVLLRKEIKPIKVIDPLKVEIIKPYISILSPREIISELKKIYKEVVRKVNELAIKSYMLKERETPNFLVRLISLIGLYPQRLLFKNIVTELDKQLFQLNIIKSLLEKELEINNIIGIENNTPTVWTYLKIEVDDYINFKDFIKEKKRNKIYNKLYETDEGFRKLTNTIIKSFINRDGRL